MAEIALVNSNVTVPPIAPLGIECLAEACRGDGLDFELLRRRNPVPEAVSAGGQTLCGEIDLDRLFAEGKGQRLLGGGLGLLWTRGDVPGRLVETVHNQDL